jgi:DNA-binding Lrp family transcriptional regulator
VRELTDLELNILMILADNKGHALWELAERLGKEKSNLILTLNRLEDKIELSNPYGISCYDIIDTNSLGLKFHEPKDLLSQYIRTQFRPDTIRLMDSNIDNFSLYVYFELE